MTANSRILDYKRLRLFSGDDTIFVVRTNNNSNNSHNNSSYYNGNGESSGIRGTSSSDDDDNNNNDQDDSHRDPRREMMKMMMMMTMSQHHQDPNTITTTSSSSIVFSPSPSPFRHRQQAPQSIWHVANIVNLHLPGLLWSDPESTGRWQRWLLRAIPEMVNLARLDVRDGQMGDLWCRALIDALIEQKVNAGVKRSLLLETSSALSPRVKMQHQNVSSRDAPPPSAGEGVDDEEEVPRRRRQGTQQQDDENESSLSSSPPIFVLHMENNFITQQSIQHVGRLFSAVASQLCASTTSAGGGGFLVELYLTGNTKIGDHGAQVLAAHALKGASVREVTNRVTLRFLDISGCDVGGRGLSDLLSNCGAFCNAIICEGWKHAQSQANQHQLEQHLHAAVPPMNVAPSCSIVSRDAMRNIPAVAALRVIDFSGNGVRLLGSTALHVLLPALLVCCPRIRAIGMAHTIRNPEQQQHRHQQHPQQQQQGRAAPAASLFTTPSQLVRSLIDSLTSLCRSGQRASSLEYLDLSGCFVSDQSILKLIEFVTREKAREQQQQQLHHHLVATMTRTSTNKGSGPTIPPSSSFLRLRILDVSDGEVLADDDKAKAPITIGATTAATDATAAPTTTQLHVRSSLGKVTWRAIMLACAMEDDETLDVISEAAMIDRSGGTDKARRQSQEEVEVENALSDDGNKRLRDGDKKKLHDYIHAVSSSPSSRYEHHLKKSRMSKKHTDADASRREQLRQQEENEMLHRLQVEASELKKKKRMQQEDEQEAAADEMRRFDLAERQQRQARYHQQQRDAAAAVESEQTRQSRKAADEEAEHEQRRQQHPQQKDHDDEATSRQQERQNEQDATDAPAAAAATRRLEDESVATADTSKLPSLVASPIVPPPPPGPGAPRQDRRYNNDNDIIKDDDDDDDDDGDDDDTARICVLNPGSSDKKNLQNGDNDQESSSTSSASPRRADRALDFTSNNNDNNNTNNNNNRPPEASTSSSSSASLSSVVSDAMSILQHANANLLSLNNRAYTFTIPHEPDAHPLLCATINLIAGAVPTSPLFAQLFLADLQSYINVHHNNNNNNNNNVNINKNDTSHNVVVEQVRVFLDGTYAITAKTSARRHVADHLIRSAFNAPAHESFPRLLRVVTGVAERQQHENASTTLLVLPTDGSTIVCAKIERCQRHKHLSLELPPCVAAAAAAPTTTTTTIAPAITVAPPAQVQQQQHEGEANVQPKLEHVTTATTTTKEQVEQVESLPRTKVDESDEARKQVAESKLDNNDEPSSTALTTSIPIPPQMQKEELSPAEAPIAGGAAISNNNNIPSSTNSNPTLSLKERLQAKLEAEKKKRLELQQQQQQPPETSTARTVVPTHDVDDHQLKPSAAPETDHQPRNDNEDEKQSEAINNGERNGEKVHTEDKENVDKGDDDQVGSPGPPPPPPKTAPPLQQTQQAQQRHQQHINVFNFEDYVKSAQERSTIKNNAAIQNGRPASLLLRSSIHHAEVADGGRGGANTSFHANNKNDAASIADGGSRRSASTDLFVPPHSASSLSSPSSSPAAPASVDELTAAVPLLQQDSHRATIRNFFSLCLKSLKDGEAVIPSDDSSSSSSDAFGPRDKRRLFKGWFADRVQPNDVESERPLDHDEAPRSKMQPIVVNVEWKHFLVIKTCDGGSRALYFMHPLLGNALVPSSSSSSSSSSSAAAAKNTSSGNRKVEPLCRVGGANSVVFFFATPRGNVHTMTFVLDPEQFGDEWEEETKNKNSSASSSSPSSTSGAVKVLNRLNYAIQASSSSKIFSSNN